MLKLVQLHKKQLHLLVLSSLMVGKKKKRNGEYSYKLCRPIFSYLVVFLISYIQHLRGAKRSGLQKDIVTGLSMGIYYMFFFGIGGLAYW